MKNIKNPLCGCAQEGHLGVQFNQISGEPHTCPNCNGSGSMDPNYIPRFKAYTMIPQTPGQTYLAANTYFEGQIQIDSNYDFVGIFLTGSCTSSASLGGGCTLQIWDPSAVRSWFDAPVNFSNIVGTGQNQFPIGLIPQRVPANWQLPWKITDFSGSNNTIQIVMSGYEMVPVASSSPGITAG